MIFKMIYSIALWSLFITSSFGHTVHMGRTCPRIEALPNLSVNKILGAWYVVYQFDTANTCMIWNLTRSTTDVDQLELKETRQLYLLDALGVNHTHSITATIDVPNIEIPSRMRIRWPTSLTGKADFIVFDTDYDNYLAIFQCDRAGIVHRRDVTVLSKTPEVDDMFIKRVRRLLDTAEIAHTSLNRINHNVCRNASKRNWHIQGEIFGLLPPSQSEPIKTLSTGVHDYDTSEIEIIGDGISAIEANTFKGSVKKTEPKV